jgi:hypothetical protein
MAVGGQNSDWRTGTNGATTSLTNFTSKTMSVSANFEAEEAESTVFGDSYRDFEQTFKNASIEVEYKYDATIFAQLAAIYNNGDSVDFQLSPDGTTSGKPKITGAAIITSFGTPVQIGDVLKLNVGYRCNGAITFSTYA